MITKEIAKSLVSGTILYHLYKLDSKGQSIKCRANGKCKTWKRMPLSFRLPVKYGLRECFYIDETNGKDWRREDE